MKIIWEKLVKDILEYSLHKQTELKKRAYPVQRVPALCGVWGRVLAASLTLACAMRGDRDSNPSKQNYRVKTK